MASANQNILNLANLDLYDTNNNSQLPAPPGNSQPEKKKRVSQACDACRRRKYKCDGVRPICTTCAKSSLECTWTPRPSQEQQAAVPEKPKGPRAQYVDSLRKRLKELEALVAAGASGQPGAALPSHDGAQNGVFLPPPPFNTRIEDRVRPSDRNAIDAFLTGSMKFPMEERLGNREKSGSRESSSSTATTDESSEDFDYSPEVYEELIMLFFACHYHLQPLFFLKRGLFVRTPLDQHPRALLEAVCCCAAKYSVHPTFLNKGDTPKYLLGDLLYNRARKKLMAQVDNPTLVTVQGLLCVASHAMESGRASAAWMYFNMAHLSAYVLKLNVDPDELPEPMTMLEKETRRRTWWSCYITDCLVSIFVDRARIIKCGSFTTKLPVPERIWDFMRKDLPPTTEEAAPPFTLQMGLAGIQNDPVRATILLLDIVSKIWSATTFFKHLRDETELPPAYNEARALYFCELEAFNLELKAWYSALPTWMRQPGLVFAPELGSWCPPSWYVAFMHLIYQVARILLHRPAMMVAMRDCPHVARLNEHWLECADAAFSMANLLATAVLPVNAPLHHLHPFTMFCVFQGALVHLLTAQLAEVVGDRLADGAGPFPDTIFHLSSVQDVNIQANASVSVFPANGEAPGNPGEQNSKMQSLLRRMAIGALQVHLQALQGMAAHWEPASELLLTMRNLLQVAGLNLWVYSSLPEDRKNAAQSYPSSTSHPDKPQSQLAASVSANSYAEPAVATSKKLYQLAFDHTVEECVARNGGVMCAEHQRAQRKMEAMKVPGEPTIFETSLAAAAALGPGGHDFGAVTTSGIPQNVLLGVGLSPVTGVAAMNVAGGSYAVPRTYGTGTPQGVLTASATQDPGYPSIRPPVTMNQQQQQQQQQPQPQTTHTDVPAFAQFSHRIEDAMLFSLNTTRGSRMQDVPMNFGLPPPVQNTMASSSSQQTFSMTPMQFEYGQQSQGQAYGGIGQGNAGAGYGFVNVRAGSGYA
ncbi:fungal-specific transcription factor domain-containing protein [Cladochytrium replicatum]|nr:fungal-specific transcription factor domain-containing protein [Cladochytrium replicatum]